MLTLIPLPAFEDNYIWVLHDGHHAVAVDPGDPAPLMAFIEAHQLALSAVLITHHHRDHTGGNVALRQRYQCAIYAPDNPRIPAVTHTLRGGDSLILPEPALHFEVLATPAAAPWMKISEAVDYLRAVAPRHAVPIHQGIIAAEARGIFYGRLTEMTDTDFRVLPEENSVRF